MAASGEHLSDAWISAPARHPLDRSPIAQNCGRGTCRRSEVLPAIKCSESIKETYSKHHPQAGRGAVVSACSEKLPSMPRHASMS